MSRVRDDAVDVEFSRRIVGEHVEAGAQLSGRDRAHDEGVSIERLRKMPTWSNHVVLHPMISQSE